ncbi:MAG TPA: glycosyltransferase family 2 protein [Gaiellaceae bacterium]|nr:glycosyltransferase family 2 protein [Gaiellaceae bacterium]
MTPRIAVIVPCHGDGPLVADAVHSVVEEEPVELVVADDASPDDDTRRTLAALEAEGVRVLRLETRSGPGIARTRALAATSAPFVYPLDADDLALPGIVSRMADVLEANPAAAACVGDIVEFGAGTELVRRVPGRLDPYRVALTNEYPVTALFRRTALEACDGWQRLHSRFGYEDWNLWMALAERGERIVHVGAPGYRRRLHGRRLNQDARERHRILYAELRRAHPALFDRLREHRASSDLSPAKRLLYPVLFGARASVPLERMLKPWFDRLGLWTRAVPQRRGGRRGRRSAG